MSLKETNRYARERKMDIKRKILVSYPSNSWLPFAGLTMGIDWFKVIKKDIEWEKHS